MGRFDSAMDNYFDTSDKKFIDKEGKFIGRVVHAYSGTTKNGKEFIKMFAQTEDSELCSIEFWFSSQQSEAASVTILSKCGISRADIAKCDEVNQIAALVKLRAPVIEFETEKVPSWKDEDVEVVQYKAFSAKAPEKISVKEGEFIAPVAITIDKSVPAASSGVSGDDFKVIDNNEDLPF